MKEKATWRVYIIPVPCTVLTDDTIARKTKRSHCVISADIDTGTANIAMLPDLKMSAKYGHDEANPTNHL